MRICKHNSCEKKHDSHGYCSNHARQFRRWGRIRTKEEQAKEISDRNRGNKYVEGKTWKVKDTSRMKGRHPISEFKKGVVAWNTGLTNWISKDHLEALRQANIGKTPWNKGLWGYNSGEKNPNWKGGAHTKNNALRRTKRYRHWRTAVFERDDYTCQMCSLRGVYLEADHIKPFAFFPELRFEINNGRTLCKECHMQTPTYKKHKYMEVTS